MNNKQPTEYEGMKLTMEPLLIAKKVFGVFCTTALVLLATFALGMLLTSCTKMPPDPVWSTQQDQTRLVSVPIGVVTTKDYAEPTKYAAELWNAAAGCTIFQPGMDVIIRGANGSPCDQPRFAQTSDSKVQAHAYHCPSGQWDVQISKPGDIHDQYCIITQQLGIVLGLATGDRNKRSAMGNTCPDFPRISDADRAAVAQRYCK